MQRALQVSSFQRASNKPLKFYSSSWNIASLAKQRHSTETALEFASLLRTCRAIFHIRSGGMSCTCCSATKLTLCPPAVKQFCCNLLVALNMYLYNRQFIKKKQRSHGHFLLRCCCPDNEKQGQPRMDRTTWTRAFRLSEMQQTLEINTSINLIMRAECQ